MLLYCSWNSTDIDNRGFVRGEDMEKERTDLKGKRILVVGLGSSGKAASQALVKLGATVCVQDAKKEEEIEPNIITFLRGLGVKFFFDTVPEPISYFDMMVLSPGVPTDLPFIVEARDKGVEIIGELEIAYRLGGGNYVAITGTNGKTTTTSLVGEIFRKAGRKTSVVGNIGVAVISASIDAEDDDWLITECSSFQLETTRYFRPVVAGILNLTPDHLYRHHTMEEYAGAKSRIFQNQSEEDHLIINGDDPRCVEMAKGAASKVIPFSLEKELCPGVFTKDDAVFISDDDGRTYHICDIQEINIIGRHNLANTLAAAGMCFFAGIAPEDIRSGIRSFRGVAHRIEFCGEISGVRYYNDSKGTNTDAAITALKAIDGDVILIAGGDAKEQDFTDLVKEFPGKVRELILLGRDAHMIEEACEKQGFDSITGCSNMEECVKTAGELAREGDTVLLSPACASWDMYDNFEQRGDHFRSLVERLTK